MIQKKLIKSALTYPPYLLCNLAKPAAKKEATSLDPGAKADAAKPAAKKEAAAPKAMEVKIEEVEEASSSAGPAPGAQLSQLISTVTGLEASHLTKLVPVLFDAMMSNLRVLQDCL